MARRSTSSLDSPSAKVIAVLDAVASRRVASVSAIASDLAIPTPTIDRIAIELERLGYRQREPGSRHLTVSEPLVSLASNVLLAASGEAAVQAILRKVSEAVGEMCSLGVQVGDEVVYIASAEPQQDLMLSFRAGAQSALRLHLERAPFPGPAFLGVVCLPRRQPTQGPHELHAHRQPPHYERHSRGPCAGLRDIKPGLHPAYRRGGRARRHAARQAPGGALGIGAERARRPRAPTRVCSATATRRRRAGRVPCSDRQAHA
jgi:hypothetical protein